MVNLERKCRLLAIAVRPCPRVRMSCELRELFISLAPRLLGLSHPSQTHQPLLYLVKGLRYDGRWLPRIDHVTYGLD